MKQPRISSAAEQPIGPVAETVSDLVPLLVLGVGMIYSNRLFTYIDDEVSMLAAAVQPVRATLALFLSGAGQYEHPPLYDLWLHVWLLVSAGAFAWLRIPSILFFLAGLWMLSRAALRIGGSVSAAACVWLGMLWPYGFHFGRLAGWYSSVFLLISLLTWAYLRYFDSPSPKAWALVCFLSLALVYTNYFGWALLALLGVEDWIRNRRIAARTGLRLGATAAFLLIVYAPLWRAFINELSTGTHLHQSWKVLVLNAAYNVYVLFVSESVGPWFWRLGICATVAVALCLVLAFVVGRGSARRFLLYAGILLVAMDLIGILATKRLFVLAPWVMLAIAVALGTAKNSYLRRGLALVLLVVAGIGWYGIYTRRYYAAPRFVEPWGELASETAQTLREGTGVIGNNGSFFFYLTYALRVPPSNGRWHFRGLLPDDVHYPQVWSAEDWLAAGRPIRPYMLWIEGMPMGGAMDEAAVSLGKVCGGRIIRHLVRDPGYVWKQRFLPELGEPAWRIEIEQYACDQGGNSLPPVSGLGGASTR